MAYERRSFAGGAPSTTLSGSMDATTGTFSVATGGGTGYPTGSAGNFWIVVDRGTSKEEKMLIASRSGDVFTLAGTRGDHSDGTTVQTHATGSTVEHVMTSEDADEANKAVSETIGKVTAAGSLLYATGAGTFTELVAGTSSQVLQGGTAPMWGNQSTSDISGFTAAVQAIVTAGLTAGANISLTGTYPLTIAVTGLTSSQVSDFAAAVGTIVGAYGLGGSGLAYNGTTKVLDVNVDGVTMQVTADALAVKTIGLSNISLASDPSASTDAARKGYVDAHDLSWSTTAISGGAPASNPIASKTITDPGYDITVWGSTTCRFEVIGGTTTWQQILLAMSVDAVSKDQLWVPWAQAMQGNVVISVGVPLRPTNHTTGTNCTVSAAISKTGDGTLSTSSVAVEGSMSLFWRKT